MKTETGLFAPLRGRHPDLAAALLIPIALVLLIFAVFGYAPFGGNALTVYDANIQYLDLFAYFKDVLSGENAIGYTFGRTLGGSNLSVFSYYLASPLNLLAVFFEKSRLHCFFDLLVCLKLGLISLAMELFLLNRFDGYGWDRLPDRLLRLLFVLLSVSFGLCQYALAQSSNIMWLDGVILLPLMLLGVYRIVRGGSGITLALSAACSILCCWYTGGINCLFAILWLAFESLLTEAEQKNACPGVLRRMAVRVWRFGVYMALGVLLSCILFLPTVVSMLGSGRGSLDTDLFSSRESVGSALSLLTNWCIGAVSDKGSVSLFCGSLAAVGFLCLFVNREIPGRVRLCFAAMTLAVTSLFFLSPLIQLYSLLKPVTSYWYRYSYVGSFFLIFGAAYSLLRLRSLPPFMPAAAALVFGFLLVQARRVAGDSSAIGPFAALVKTLVLLAVVSLLLAFLLQLHRMQVTGSFGRLITGAVPLLLACGVLFECFCSAKQLWDRYHIDSTDTIMVYTDDQQAQIDALKAFDSGLYRVSQTSDRGTMIVNPAAVIGHTYPKGASAVSQQTVPKLSTSVAYNESLAYNYRSISGYLSSPDENQRALLDALGYRICGENFNVLNTSILPADSLLGVKYVLTDLPVPGLKPVEGLPEVFGKRVYENPYALPMALLWSGSDDAAPAGEPFLYQNALYSELLGEEVTLWVEVPFTKEAISEREWVYELTLPENCSSIYGNLPASWSFHATLQLNGIVSCSYACWGSPSVFPVPFDEGSTTAGVRITSANAIALKEGMEQFYSLDFAELDRVTGLLQSRSVDYTAFENGHVSLTVTGKQGQKLLLSIPADKGWVITRNDNAVEPELFGSCLLSIPLTEGINEIELHYRVPGLWVGAICTLAASLLLLCCELLRRKHVRFQKKEANAMEKPARSESSPKPIPADSGKHSRVEWIDLAKALGILMVIVSHSVGKDFLGALLRAALFSFHMPLFFMLSLMTYRCAGTTSEYLEKLKHAAKHLLIPALIVFAAFSAAGCIWTPANTFSFSYWKGRLFTLLFSSGVKLTFAGLEVTELGIPWFLVVLFLSRALFDYLHLLLKDERKLALWCTVLSCAGVLFGRLQWLPFSADIALAVLPFLWIGHSMKPEKLGRQPLKQLLFWGLVFMFTLYLTTPAGGDRTYLELAQRRYPLFPICFLCAYAGSICVCEFSILCCKAKKLFTPLIFVGRNAMWLLLVHMLDEFWKRLWLVEGRQFHTAARRVAVDIAIFLTVMGIRALLKRAGKRCK